MLCSDDKHIEPQEVVYLYDLQTKLDEMESIEDRRLVIDEYIKGVRDPRTCYTLFWKLVGDHFFYALNTRGGTKICLSHVLKLLRHAPFFPSIELHSHGLTGRSPFVFFLFARTRIEEMTPFPEDVCLMPVTLRAPLASMIQCGDFIIRQQNLHTNYWALSMHCLHNYFVEQLETLRSHLMDFFILAVRERLAELLGRSKQPRHKMDEETASFLADLAEEESLRGVVLESLRNTVNYPTRLWHTIPEKGIHQF